MMQGAWQRAQQAQAARLPKRRGGRPGRGPGRGPGSRDGCWAWERAWELGTGRWALGLGAGPASALPPAAPSLGSPPAPTASGRCMIYASNTGS